ncbi:FAD-binding protein [Nonomuraea thailandensis]
MEPGRTGGGLRAAAGLHRAATVAELAAAAGISGDGLSAQVRRYNEAVARGLDEDFGRRHLPAPIAEPPFYAIENHPVTLITFAGVDVDECLRVRRADGRVVPGLYAVGEVIGSAAVNGNAFCSGMCLTPALAFGRIVGRALASSARAAAPSGRAVASAFEPEAEPP